MIALEDCIALCGLTREQVLALAEHEHIPEISAAALANHLLAQPEGCRRVSAMIADDITFAEARGDRRHADELRRTLHEFVATHPDALSSLRARARLNAIRRRSV